MEVGGFNPMAIWKIDLATGEEREIIPHNANSGGRPGQYEPAYSPDGRYIALTGFDFNGDGDVFIANADGTGRRPLTCTGGSQPAWSPDGTKIVFGRSADQHLWVINVDDDNCSGARQLTS
jgi:TolB protein